MRYDDAYELSLKSINLMDKRLVRLSNNDPDSDIVDLNQSEKIEFNAFLCALSESSQRRNTKVLFRGDDKKRIRNKLNISSGVANERELLDRLFYFGDKGIHFLKDSQEQIVNRNYLTSINDIELPTFEFIFHKIHDTLSWEKVNKLCITAGFKKAFKRFTKQNDEFIEYFSSTANLIGFTLAINNLSPDQRLTARDYYLSLLHTIGKKGLTGISFFVSASTDFYIARKFSEKGTRTEPIILVSWLQEPINKRAINLQIIRNQIDHLKDNNLPIYSSNLYPDQREVSVKAAIFPQRMLGILDKRRNHFVVNDHFFDEINSDIDNAISYGFYINQCNLDNDILDTNYGKTIWILEGGSLFSEGK